LATVDSQVCEEWNIEKLTDAVVEIEEEMDYTRRVNETKPRGNEA